MAKPRMTLVLVLLLGLGGCQKGDGLERVVVTGKVTLAGQPLPHGQLRFVPQPGTIGPVTIVAIESGQYRAETYGGVPVGKHRVEILAYNLDAQGGEWPSGPGAKPPPQLLPPKYNSRSELQVELTAGQPATVHDFELKR